MNVEILTGAPDKRGRYGRYVGKVCAGDTDGGPGGAGGGLGNLAPETFALKTPAVVR